MPDFFFIYNNKILQIAYIFQTNFFWKLVLSSIQRCKNLIMYYVWCLENVWCSKEKKKELKLNLVVGWNNSGNWQHVTLKIIKFCEKHHKIKTTHRARFEKKISSNRVLYIVFIKGDFLLTFIILIVESCQCQNDISIMLAHFCLS